MSTRIVAPPPLRWYDTQSPTRTEVQVGLRFPSSGASRARTGDPLFVGHSERSPARRRRMPHHISHGQYRQRFPAITSPLLRGTLAHHGSQEIMGSCAGCHFSAFVEVEPCLVSLMAGPYDAGMGLGCSLGLTPWGSEQPMRSGSCRAIGLPVSEPPRSGETPQAVCLSHHRALLTASSLHPP